jgi:hypothetical protein
VTASRPKRRARNSAYTADHGDRHDGVGNNGNLAVAQISESAMNSPTVSAKGLRAAALELWTMSAIALFAFFLIRFGVREELIGFDFRGTLWDAALAIREDRSPYPAANVAEVDVGNPALYPPLLMLVVLPITFLPWSVGFAVWTTLLGAAVAGALYILNVRDFKCYLVALLSLPITIGFVFGNAALLLVPLVALAWRWRDRWLRSGIVVGLAIGSKLFLWPLLVWLLATRRYRAFGAAVVATGASILLPWALIGFDGISSYPDLLRVAEDVYAGHSYSVATMLSALGTDTQLASRAALALGVAIAATAFIAGRRHVDRTSMSLALAAAVIGSPIVWPYYYALILVPIAIARPRFSLPWAALALFYAVELLPRSDLTTAVPCCRPADVPSHVWLFNHSPPGLWPALGYAVLAGALLMVSVRAMHRNAAA